MNASLSMPMLLAVADGGAADQRGGTLLHRGLFAPIFELPDHYPLLRMVLNVGICGGFTTFSTLSAEIVTLLQQGKADRAALYASLSIAAGVLATFAGLMVGRLTR